MSTATAPIVTEFGSAIDEDHARTLEVRQIIRDFSNGMARSVQKKLGPSQAGEPCVRRLAYSLLEIPKNNLDSDPLPSLVGTGAHDMLAKAFEAHNRTLGWKRWVVEERVQCGPLAGTGDLYDALYKTVIDHKFPGATGLKKYKSAGPSQVYRMQAHLYGKGHIAAGRPVERVAIDFYPRGGFLSGSFRWSEPYDETIADQAIERLHGIALAVDMWMGTTGGNKAATLANMPPQFSTLCNWCEYLRYGDNSDLSIGCPGTQM